MKIGLAVILLFGTSFNAKAQSNYLDIVRVTDSIYVFKPKIDWTHGNGVAIIGSDGVFFIDTYLQSNYAREAIKKLKKITRLPVRFVSYTHHHSDHVMGSYEFKKSFPACKFIMLDSADTYFRKQIAPDISKDLDRYKGELAQLEKETREGKTSDGYPLTGSMIPFWSLQVNEAKEFIKSHKPNKPVYADIIYSDTLKFKWGNQSIQLFPTRDRGHSRGDVFIWIPEKRIAIVGDIIVSPTAYALYPNIPGMLQSIDRILKMNPAIIIPGHGEVEYDLSYIKRLKETYDLYIAEIKKAIENNLPYKDAIATVKLQGQDEIFTHNDEAKTWAYEYFFRRPLIRDIYQKFSNIPTR